MGSSSSPPTPPPPEPVIPPAQVQAESSIPIASTSPKLKSPSLSSPPPPAPYVETELEAEPEPEKIALPGSPKQTGVTGEADGPAAQGGSGKAVSPPLPPWRPAPTVEDVDDEGEDEGNRGREERSLGQKQGEPEVKKQSESISSEKPVPAVSSTPVNQPSASVVEPLAGSDSIGTEKKEQEKEGIEKEGVKEQEKKEEEKKKEDEVEKKDENKGPFIRPYDSSIDFYDCLEICHNTAAPSLLPLLSTPHASLISSIWCKPYLLFSPSTCFVLDDGSEIYSSLPPIVPLSPPTSSTEQPQRTPRKPGKPIGYILGTPSTTQFIKTYKSDYLPLLDVHYPLPHPQQLLSELAKSKNEWLLETLFNPDKAMDLGKDFLTKWPAHFHVNILEGWRSVGWGRNLLGVWEAELKRVWSGWGWIGGKNAGVEGCHIGMDPANERAGKWYLRNGFVEVGKEELEGKGEETKWLVKKLV